jgi:hypothetical protein
MSQKQSRWDFVPHSQIPVPGQLCFRDRGSRLEGQGIDFLLHMLKKPKKMLVNCIKFHLFEFNMIGYVTE